MIKKSSPLYFWLVWRRHTKFWIGMAAAIPAIPLPAPLFVYAYVDILGFWGEAPAAKRFPGYYIGAYVSAGWGKVAVIFSITRPKSGGYGTPHSRKWGVRVSNAVVSNCFNHHIYHLHVHRFRYDRTTNVLSLLIFNACNRAAWCKLVDQSDVGWTISISGKLRLCCRSNEFAAPWRS